MVPTQEQAADNLPPEGKQTGQNEWEERRIDRQGKRWAIVVSVITALTSLAVAIARLIEVLSAGSKC